MGGEVTDLVPDCVGLSLASADTASRSRSSPRTGTPVPQRHPGSGRDHGPGSRVEREPDVITWDLLDEDMWHLPAMASASTCIVSTLTLPIVKDGHIAGAVNLYGASRQAFTGHHEALAESSAPGRRAR